MTQTVISVEEAWLAYRQKLLNFITSKIENKEDAEELLNEVFIKLTEAINKNTPPDNISAWLYRVTKNSIIDYYRTKKHFEPLAENVSENNSTNNEEMDTIKQLSQCILPMINALPETYQQPLMLSEIEGYKYQEVATTLGISVSAVKSRILRGREKLHKSMVSCCTIHKNDSNETVDYDKKMGSSCSNC
jgi:RNA polymerase sigma-70 factor (ECF subfamily)